MKSEYKRVNITTQVKQFYAKVVKTQMAEVKVGENESIESALKRFKKKIQKAINMARSKGGNRYIIYKEFLHGEIEDSDK